jgi:WD40 repeat protein
VSLWDVDAYASPETLPVLDKRTFDLAFSPDGTWLVIAGSGSLHVYNLQESSLASSIVCHKFAVASVNFTQDGNHLVATGAEGALSIWNSSTWDERQRIQLPAKGVLQTALAPDSSTVYVSMDHRIAGYALDDGRTTMEIELPIKGVYGLAVSPDGVWLANAAADGKIRVWEL